MPPLPPKDFPPSKWSRAERKIYYAIESIILDNNKLAGDKLLDKIKEVLAK